MGAVDGVISRPSVEVLVVDDEPLVLRVAVRALLSAGILATGELDATSALALLTQAPERFAAVITDMRMPKMSGLALARCVRDIAPNVAIVLHSGNVPDAANELELFDAVLEKPSSPAELVQAVKALISHRPGG